MVYSKNIIMKKLFLPIAICSSFLLFAQQIITKSIISFNTHERNAKTVLFEQQDLDHNTNFLLKAENKSSKDFTKCKWITSLSQDQLIYFIDVLENLEAGSSVESRLFNFMYKKNKIKIHIKDSRCTSEHKTYYFQESCKRRLSFVILEGDKSEITSALKQVLREIEYVRK